MRPRGRSLLAFGAGLLVGGVVAAGAVGWRWAHDFNRFRVMGVAEQALAAREIYAGRGHQTADRIRGALPALILGVERSSPRPEGREWAYWLANDVYKASGVAVPAQIKPLLAALPPRSSCEKPASNGKYPVAP